MFTISKQGEIQLTRGDTARIAVSIVNDEGEPYEIQSDDTLTLSVKKNIEDEDFAFQKSIAGENVFLIEPQDTKHLSFGRHKYDVQLTTADGEVYTVIAPSTFEIMQEVG